MFIYKAFFEQGSRAPDQKELVAWLKFYLSSRWQFNEQKMSCLMTKPTKWHVQTVKIQISLGFCPVWSESSLSTWRNLGSLATHWMHSKDSDQTGRMPRLIWIFAGCSHFVDFVMRWLKSVFHLTGKRRPEEDIKELNQKNKITKDMVGFLFCKS